MKFLFRCSFYNKCLSASLRRMLRTFQYPALASRVPAPSSAYFCNITQMDLDPPKHRSIPLRKGKRIINVGSRKSQLALIQTNLVIRQLQELFSNNPDLLQAIGYEDGISFNILSMTTSGDQILDKALPDIGSKSLFTRELEVALLAKQVDFVVHSLKDLPTTLPAGCAIGAILKRDNPEDVIVLKKSLRSVVEPMDLLFGDTDKLRETKIGTSSQRRIAMLRRCNENLECSNIRGNLNTRLAKLDDDEGEYAAIILAKAGLKRMKWSERASSLLTPVQDSRLKDWCYAVGQGAIAVECRHDDEEILKLLAFITHGQTMCEAVAERSLMRKLEGGCSVPLGVRTHFSEDGRSLSLRAIVLSLDGKQSIEATDDVELPGSNTGEIHDKSRSELILSTTGIIPPNDDAQMDLIECSNLGLKVAIKMMERGCMRLMSLSK